MPDCFWAGFLNSREPGCSADSPPPDLCDGVPPPPASFDICGSTGGGDECEVNWVVCDSTPIPAGYSLAAGSLGCRNFASTPTTVTLIRECDAATFIVPVGDADIVCC